MALNIGVASKEPLNVELIRGQLSIHTVGRRIYLFDEVTSTNEVLRRLAKEGAEEGTTVLAESQSAGQGRLGKRWFSPPGVNLYASILFRPAIEPRKAPVFSFIASLALADAIRDLGLSPAIKWPNDILLDRKKVAGVLVETSISGDLLDHAIIGVGVNVNVEREALVEALGTAGRAATSLLEIKGKPIDRNGFAAGFLSSLDEWWRVYRGHGEEALIRAWRDLDILTGRRVEVRGETSTIDARVLGVDAEGQLLVQDSMGRVRQIIGGEIRLLD